ncbi:hypothetical protein [Akkermansia sp.]|uniref:hypothetical protein n=1 Tax=Akkermansia sp. TaxID=1872421 RepID=UPI003A8FA6CD
MSSSSSIPYCLPPDGKYDREGGVIIHMMSDKDRNSGLPPQDGYFRIECTPGGHRIVCIPKLIMRLKSVTKTVRKSKKKKEEDEILFFLADEGRCLLTVSHSNQRKEQLEEEYELVDVVDNLLNREEFKEIQDRMRSTCQGKNPEFLQADVDRLRSEEEDKYLVHTDIDAEEACFIKSLLKNRNCAREWVESSRREISIEKAILNETLKKSGEIFLRAIQEKKALVFKAGNWIVENDLGKYFFHHEYVWSPELQTQLEDDDQFKKGYPILVELCRKCHGKGLSYTNLEQTVSLKDCREIAWEAGNDFLEELQTQEFKRYLERLGFHWILTRYKKPGRPKNYNRIERKPLSGREANKRSTEPNSKRGKRK